MYHYAVAENSTSIGSNKGQNLPKSLSNKKIRRNRRTSSKSPIKAASSKSRKNSLGSTCSMYFFAQKKPNKHDLITNRYFLCVEKK